MTASILRSKWISFFESKGHLDLSNMPVVPPSSDKSLLFINSGVAAIKAYFYGDIETPSKRIVSCQKVIRTGDIDSIGDSFRHNTYFEMLGNFSIGDYFKREAILWAWEFLTQELSIEPEQLYVTVYEEDQEAFDEWCRVIDLSRIIKGNKDTNFWDMGVGPCGPCTEIYYDKGDRYDPENRGLSMLINNEDNERYLEIWNIVFSEYLNVDGNIVKAPQKNIDTGAGLIRLLSVLEGKDNNFETSLFTPIISYLKQNFGALKKNNLWAISDYLRTSCLLLNEGIKFGNKGREYVLRKIFRKSLQLIGGDALDKDFFSGLVEVISESLPYYEWNREKISKLMHREASLYLETHVIALRFLNEIMQKYPKEVPEEEIFNLVTSHGLDYCNIEKILLEHGRSFNRDRYDELIEKHRDVSQNQNISSAFLKKHPSLLGLTISSEMDYESVSLSSHVIALFDLDFSQQEEIDSGYVVLDKTVVFPCSGGQDQDTGTIDGFPIIGSFKAPNGQILHEVRGRYRLHQLVEVTRDSEKRYGLEIHHTLEHLFYELLRREISPKIERSSGSKYSDYFALEISVPEDISKDSFDLKDLNRKLNDLIKQKLEVNIGYITLQEAKDMGMSQYFEEVYKKSFDRLRLVDIGGYSRELCIGTHVKNTESIGKCLIIECKKKQSNVYRFKVLAGPYVDAFLKSLDVDSYYDRNDEETIRRQKALRKEEFNLQKQKLIEELLSSPEKLLVVRRNIDPSLALSVFKEIRSRMHDKTIFLFFQEDSQENFYRFFVVSDVLDVSKLLKIYRDQYTWKCGGNEGFGSGMGFGEDFRKKAIQPLEFKSVS